MARYIKAVECADIISEKLNIPLGDLVDIFAEIPTADVVPKSEVIRCKDCNYFREYSSEYSRTTENADGDCHIRMMNSDNEQYFACQYDDFCSFAKMEGGE